MLKAGDPAPNFALQSREGVHKLSDARGKYAVVYFYPRDNTPGCTREGQAFSLAAKRFAAAGAVVYGISKDSVESHDRFADTCSITIDLLSDADLATHKAWPRPSGTNSSASPKPFRIRSSSMSGVSDPSRS